MSGVGQKVQIWLQYNWLRKRRNSQPPNLKNIKVLIPTAMRIADMSRPKLRCAAGLPWRLGADRQILTQHNPAPGLADFFPLEVCYGSDPLFRSVHRPRT